MNELPNASTYSYHVPGIDSRTMMLYCGISLLFHLIFLGGMLLFSESAPRRRLTSGVINVSLVSLPGPATPSPASKPATGAVSLPEREKKPAPKASVVEKPPPEPQPPPPKAKETVSLAAKEETWRIKRSLKKKTINRQKMIQHAVTEVEKDVEKSKSDSVKQALEQLKKKVAQTEAGPAQRSQAARDTTDATGAGTAGASGSGGQRKLEIIDIYKIEVAFQVERNWAFPEQLAGNGRSLQASLVFKVLPNGDIADIMFTERSGNSYLDESAYKAIVKANPVSPHPAGVRLPYVTVALRFTPEGIR